MGRILGDQGQIGQEEREIKRAKSVGAKDYTLGYKRENLRVQEGTCQSTKGHIPEYKRNT